MTNLMETTLPQHLRALEQASELRRRRQRVKDRLVAAEDIVAARQMLAEAIEDQYGFLDGMKLIDLLRAGRGIDVCRVRRYLSAICAGYDKRIGELTARQRELLVEELRA